MSIPEPFMGILKRWKLPLAMGMITLVWLFFWFYPWQKELHHIYWLQLGVGLAILIVPGFCVYGLLSNRSDFKFSSVTYGFVISHLLFALLGTIGRLIHLSFETLSFLMMALSLILLLIYLLPKLKHGIKFQMDREQAAYFLSLLPVLLISFLISLIVIQRVLSDDDLTYLAYITNWQHSTSLGFNDVLFGESQLVGIRFWLMSAPFAQAFLAEISGMAGILILGGYYEPFLVVLSVLCWYELAIALNLTPKAASASVILQLLFLLLLSQYLHPGAPYFNQLSADKATAAFIFAPVFFHSLTRLLKERTRNSMFLMLLTGLSLSFMHSIILAYTAFIGGMLVLLNRDNHGLRDKLMPMAILIAIMIPQIMIRFADIPVTDSVSFDPEVVLSKSDTDSLVTRWGDTDFYGFNPNILTMTFPYEGNIPLPGPILAWGWILVPILAVIFALKRRENSVAQFILSSFILCVLAGFPLTGWIMGYFLNARMLARSVWLFPYGLSAVFVLLIFRDYIRSRKIVKSFSPNLALTALTIISFGLFLLHMRENNLPDLEKFNSKIQRYQDLAIAGQALDQQITDQAYVIGSPNLNDLIPGLSWKSDLITFRISNPSNMSYYTHKERSERISDTQRIFARSASGEEKMELLKKYNVSFLFLTPFDLRLFEELMETFPDEIKQSEVGGVVILEIDH
ncbi:MAG: DUF6077 domain-containing protein [Anaerolineales bacterium]|nr:DUF6077 domain-containing protein [Anaerolineales bacterium]